MKFSIIIPTYNRENYILIALKSVLNQAYADFEVIIVDDGSTDRTEEIVAPYVNNKVKYFRIKNSERGAARNYGCSLSTGDYITFLDSDDYYYKDYLLNAKQSIDKFDKPPFFHLAYEVITTEGKVKVRHNNIKSDDLEFIIKGNPLSCMGVFIKREVANKFRFNEDRLLAGSEDWELWLRIIANYGIKTDNRISAALVDHTSRSVLNYKEEDLLRRKDLCIYSAFCDEQVKTKYFKQRKKISSYFDSYIALHLVLSGNKKRGFYYFIKSLTDWPLSLFERRTLAIVKRLILSN